MYLDVQGLIVRATQYKDRDLLLTVLTSDLGRITVKVRNVRRRNSPLAVACQLLAYSEFTLFEYKENYIANDVRLVELFAGLRQDVNKLALATYFSQVASLISQEDAPSPELLPLLLNCLYGLASLGISEEKIKAVFELRCACLAGFFPDLSGCRSCNCESPDYFDVSSGLLECFSCRSYGDNGIRMPISSGMLEAMRYICFCDEKKIFSFSISEEAMLSLSQITETFLSTQLERGFSALDIYKSLRIGVT